MPGEIELLMTVVNLFKGMANKPNPNDWKGWNELDRQIGAPIGTNCINWIINDGDSIPNEAGNISNYIMQYGLDNIIGYSTWFQRTITAADVKNKLIKAGVTVPSQVDIHPDGPQTFFDKVKNLGGILKSTTPAATAQNGTTKLGFNWSMVGMIVFLGALITAAVRFFNPNKKKGSFFLLAILLTVNVFSQVVSNNSQGGGRNVVNTYSNQNINGVKSFQKDILVNGLHLGKGISTTTTSNTRLGINSLLLTTGQYNTAVGYATMYQNTIGIGNTAIDSIALAANTGDYNNAIGAGALQNNLAGAQNVAIGFRSLFNHPSGIQNISIGFTNQFSQTSGDGNTIIGTVDLGNISNNVVLASGINGTIRARFDGTYWALPYRTNINGAGDDSQFSLGNNGTINTVGLSITQTAISGTQTITGGTKINNGGAATWTLDNPFANNKMFIIKNAGSGIITINAYSGTNIIDNSNVSQSSITVAVGETVWLQHDGNVKTYQLK